MGAKKQRSLSSLQARELLLFHFLHSAHRNNPLSYLPHYTPHHHVLKPSPNRRLSQPTGSPTTAQYAGTSRGRRAILSRQLHHPTKSPELDSHPTIRGLRRWHRSPWLSLHHARPWRRCIGCLRRRSREEDSRTSRCFPIKEEKEFVGISGLCFGAKTILAV